MFDDGQEPSLDEVLNRREQRVARVHELGTLFPGKAVVCYKLNIPGPIKNNEQIRELFNYGCQEIKAAAGDCLCEEIYEGPTGPEWLACLDASGEDVKRMMIQLEDGTPLARLYDVDVYEQNAAQLMSLSRHDFDLPDRRCLICEKPARVCASRRLHSVHDLQMKIIELCQEV